MAVILTRNPAYWADGFYVIPVQPGKPIVIDFQLRFKHLRKAMKAASRSDISPILCSRRSPRMCVRGIARASMRI